jgi:glycosyltransferase involved in cell wall biosynthesis
MRVLQVHNEYRHRGGEDVVVDRERDDLQAAGHDVVRYSVSNGAGALDTFKGLVFAPWNPWQVRHLSSVLTTEAPDVVHVHNTWFRLSPAVIVEVSEAGIPLVHTLHNYRWVCSNAQLLREGLPCRECVTNGRTSAVKYRCYRSSIALSVVAAVTGAIAERRGVWVNHIDRFITMTPRARDMFIEWGFPPDRFVVHPHRLPDPGHRGERPSLSDEVLYVGRLDVDKGVEQMCAAWAASRSRHRLVVIGDGPMASDLQLRFPDVSFPGHLPNDEVIHRMQHARTLLFPAVSEETFGLVVIEAMASGLPTASSSIALISDFVREAGSEWVFDVSSRHDWSRIFGLIEDDAAVDATGRRARAIFEDNFAADGAASLISVYEEAINHRRQQGYR